MARCWWLCLAAGLWTSVWTVWAVAPSRPESHDAFEPLPAGAVGRCGCERFRLRVRDALIGIAPRGRFVAVRRQEHQVELLDIATGRVVRSIRPLIFNPFQNGGTPIARFSPSGQHLALRAFGQSMVVLHDTDTGKSRETVIVAEEEQVQLDQHARKLLAVPFSGDSDEQGQLRLFCLTTGEQIWQHPIPEATAVGAALSWDGTRVAIWRVPNPRMDTSEVQWHLEIKAVEGRTPPVRLPLVGPCATAAFSPNGNTIAVVENGKNEHGEGRATLRVFNAKSARESARFLADDVESLVFSPSGRYLIGSSMEKSFRLWDLQAGKWLPVRTLPGVLFATFGFREDGQMLACGQVGQQIMVWNIQTGEILSANSGPHAMVSSLRFSASDRLVSASVAGEFVEWDVRGRSVRRDFLGLRQGEPFRFGEISEPILSPAGKLIADSTRSFYHQATGEAASEFPLDFPTRPIYCFSRDDSLVASGDPQTIEILNTETFQRTQLQSPRPAELRRLALSAERQLCAAVVSPGGSEEDEIRLYDLRTRKLAKEVAPIACQSYSPLAFAPGGEYLLFTRELSWVQILELRTGRILREFSCAGSVGDVLEVTPQGFAIAIPHRSEQDTITVFEGWSGNTRRTFHPPNKTVALAFSPDGRFLASGQETGTVYIWDMEDPVAKCPATVDLAWKTLHSDDAQEAWRGIQTLVRSPHQAIPLLRRTLRPLPEKLLSDTEVTRLIADLDHSGFAIRNRAETILAGRQREVAPQLKQALESNPSLEVRQRLRRLLARPYAPSRELISSLRAIEVLERIGSREAKQLLTHLAGGYAPSLFTLEANAALARLSRK